jgi:hypothetical protein
MFQRWFFIMLAFICFHFFLRKWFKGSVAFGAVCFLAAIMPLSYMNYLQESFSLLMLSYVVILWLIREHKTWFYCAALLLAAMNNETVLILPAVFFLEIRSSGKAVRADPADLCPGVSLDRLDSLLHRVRMSRETPWRRHPLVW